MPFHFRIIGLMLCLTAGFSNTSYGQQELYINEVLAGNSDTNFDSFLDFDDWIEIYRPEGASPSVLNIAGYYLSDNKGDLTKWEIPADDAFLTTIVSGQHLLFWADNDIDQGADHVGFKLSTDGEKLYLTEPDGLTVVDSLWFGDQVPDISLGRACDGCEEWVYFNNPTPDDDNVVEPEPAYTLFINEIMPTNTAYFDDPDYEFDPWVEIYNPNGFQVNLAGYYLSSTSDPYAFQFGATDPNDTYIAAGGYRLVWFDNQPEQGLHHSTQSLGTSGALVLSAADGSEVDVVEYDTITPETSWGRSSDGSPNWIVFDQPTPRVTNTLEFIEPAELYINEFMPDNDNDTTDVGGGHPDWIEIYNPSDVPVNLAGYYLSDNQENPTKWQVTINNPDSTTIAPGGWMLFWADEDSGQGWNHTNFKLRDSGEEIGLYSPDGFTAADEYNWGEVTIPGDVSVGRFTDGGLPWVWFGETTPDASNNGSVTGIEPIEETVLSLYPNPVVGGFLHFSQEASGSILASDGRVITSFIALESLDVREFPAGCYSLLTSDGRSLRFIKQ